MYNLSNYFSNESLWKQVKAGGWQALPYSREWRGGHLWLDPCPVVLWPHPRTPKSHILYRLLIHLAKDIVTLGGTTEWHDQPGTQYFLRKHNECRAEQGTINTLFLLEHFHLIHRTPWITEPGNSRGYKIRGKCLVVAYRNFSFHGLFCSRIVDSYLYIFKLI